MVASKADRPDRPERAAPGTAAQPTAYELALEALATPAGRTWVYHTGHLAADTSKRAKDTVASAKLRQIREVYGLLSALGQIHLTSARAGEGFEYRATRRVATVLDLAWLHGVLETGGFDPGTLRIVRVE
ncbi:MAG: hypothetical protein AAGI34_19010 [Pseudomonadota bacterium]